ncbi:MAG: hypothetical protein ACFFD1_05030, partial [Candidatus Thorarchaeota archaeon]
IVLSSDLDEYLVESIVNQIRNDFASNKESTERENLLDRLLWGVGTNLITGGLQSALGGVYKLVEIKNRPVIKISENRAKTTDPNRKKIFRIRKTNDTGAWIADVLTKFDEEAPKKGDKIFHRSDPTKHLNLPECKAEPLLINLMSKYKPLIENNIEIWRESKNHCKNQLKDIDKSHLRFLNPHVYKVSLSEPLFVIKSHFLQSYGSK